MRNVMPFLLAAILFTAATASAQSIVIAHRGASGYLPEHTLPAYAMAYAMGADYIEPDLVLTKDKEFICLHDIHLESTTNVEQVFPDRKRDDGKWYAADFTLAEIKTLEAQERLKGRFPQEHSPLQVATFQEMIDLIRGLNTSTGRSVGIYPELKEPSWHEKEGLPMEEAFLEVMTRNGYEGPGAGVYVQCFEDAPLRKFRDLGSTLPQIMLIGSASSPFITSDGLDEVMTFANGIGPAKQLIEKKIGLVNEAHKRNLKVHIWTIRKDELPAKYTDIREELRYYFDVCNVDGVFTDFPDVVASYLQNRVN